MWDRVGVTTFVRLHSGGCVLSGRPRRLGSVHGNGVGS